MVKHEWGREKLAARVKSWWFRTRGRGRALDNKWFRIRPRRLLDFACLFCLTEIPSEWITSNLVGALCPGFLISVIRKSKDNGFLVLFSDLIRTRGPFSLIFLSWVSRKSRDSKFFCSFADNILWFNQQFIFYLSRNWLRPNPPYRRACKLYNITKNIQS